MKTQSTFWVLVFLLLLTSYACHALPDVSGFQQCMTRNSWGDETYVSSDIYAANNSSFLSILGSRIQNTRFNTSDTLKPLVVVTPRHESEVQAVILCAKEQDLQVRVRGNGHDYEGLSHTSYFGNQFLILDLVNFKNITVDAVEKTAWVGGGSTLGELYYRISEKSRVLGFPAGVCPSVGVGGHISGGGYGAMLRKYGLAADNVIDVRLVDARGRILDRESMGEDVFWAIRGGGGNTFGVILAWKLNLVDVPENVTVFSVGKFLDPNVTNLVHKWQTVAPTLPKELFVRAIAVGSLHKIYVNFNSLFLGPIEKLLPILNERLPELTLTRENLTELSWAKSLLYIDGYPNAPLTDLLNATVNNGKPNNFKAKSDFVREPIPLEGWEGIWRLLRRNLTGVIVLTPYGGRMEEITEFATPSPHRGGNLFIIQQMVFRSQEGSDAMEERVSWIRRLYEYFEPYVSKSPREAFVNYRDLDIGQNHNVNCSTYEDAKVWGIKYFKNNFDKLVRAKTMIDPQNFFRNEQNTYHIIMGKEEEGEEVAAAAVTAEGCKTPEREDCRICRAASPPPPPRKKRHVGKGAAAVPTEIAFFRSPEVDLFFAMQPRRRQVFSIVE
ncbi:unnamed protein product [Cuscuta campestris]|uniref:FAD-binding PCMH-type domain-containing protein n=1 Tax=Cuscuta campestris TaxID=132261 RepID=A0A484NCH3_9ASTE|nr:unnamed protein product [Cuscuta campestris]